MARKLRGFERVLDAPSLFAVAYGEIASSLYIALGIVAAAALGLTPFVLLFTGVLFFVVSLSYAEGTAAIPETGGAATFVRRAFNDLAGFITGWALFLDFLIVMALSALFVPHYLAEAVSVSFLRDQPWDAVVGCALIAAIAAVRLSRRTQLRIGSLAVALLDLRRPGCPRPARHRLTALARDTDRGLRLRIGAGLERSGLRPATRDARLHRARDRRQSGRGNARARSHPPALALLRDRARRHRHRPDRGDRPLSVPGRREARRRSATSGSRLHSSAIAAAFEGSLPAVLVDVLRFVVAISGALILLAAATTSVSGHHAPDVFPRRARRASSRVRSTRASGARFERGDPDRSRARDRAHPGHRDRRGRRPDLPG